MNVIFGFHSNFNEKEIIKIINDLFDNVLEEYDDPLKYFMECYTREKRAAPEYVGTVAHYFSKYYSTNSFNIYKLIVDRLNSYDDTFMTFFEYIVENVLKKKDDFNGKLVITNLYKEIRTQKFPDKRVVILYNLFKSTIIRNKLVINILETGRQNEINGIFSLFNNNDESDYIINLTPIKQILDLFINDENSCKRLLGAIYKNIDLNKAYISINQQEDVTQNCSSLKYLSLLLKMCLYISEKVNDINSTKDLKQDNKDNKSDIKNVDKNSIDFTENKIIKNVELKDDQVLVYEYKFKKKYSLRSLTYITTCYAMAICYNVLPSVQKSLRQLLTMFADLSALFGGRSMEGLELKYARTSAILEDKNLYTDLYNFVDNCINKFIKRAFIKSGNVMYKISDEILVDIINFIGIGIREYSAMLPSKLVKFLLNIIAGNYNVNKHVRYITTKCISMLCEKCGFEYINKLDDKIANAFFFSVSQFMIDVKYFDMIPNIREAYNFFQELIYIIRYYCRKITFQNKDDARIVEKIFYKITSQISDSITLMVDVFKQIEKKNLAYEDIPYFKEDNLPLILDLVKVCMAGIQSLHELLTCNIINITDFAKELILPLIDLTTILLQLLSKGNCPIYSIFELNMEAMDLMKELFSLVNTCCENKHFLESIKPATDIIKYMINKINLNESLKSSLNNYLEQIKDNKYDDDEDSLPEQFIDPLSCSKIKQPVMIPDTNLIFDKSTIMTCLRGDEKNPYNRRTLTIEDFEKYNETEQVKQKIRKFTEDLESYKNKRVKK